MLEQPSSPTHGSARASAPRPSLFDYVLLLSVLVIIAGIGALNLYQPFSGDTALFLLVAEGLARGETLYVDFWDTKQPGIFAFFYVGGMLFGFSERGVHLLELLWWLSFTIVCFFALRRYFDHPWLATVAPLVLLTAYYAHLIPWIATQVESLVGFPILVSALFLIAPYQNRPTMAWGFRAAGLFAGLTVVFKLALAPLFIAFVLAATVTQVRAAPPGERLRALAVLWGNFTLGVAAVLATVCVALLILGGLREALWTWFIYPWSALDVSGPLPLDRLARGGAHLIGNFAPWLPFVAVAAWSGPRHGVSPFMRLIWLWIAMGIAIVLVQRFSWWAYHSALFFVPLSILAVRGVDIAITYLTDRTHSKAAPSLAAALLLLPGLGAVVFPTFQKADDLLPVLTSGSPDALTEYQLGFREAAYAQRIVDAIDWEQASPGPIQVFGNPYIYLRAERRQALSIHGWSVEILTPEQAQQVTDDLVRLRPEYVFVANRQGRIIAHSIPQLLSTLQTHYRVEADLLEGQWYRSIESPPE
jgi:hypothetical protein